MTQRLAEQYQRGDLVEIDLSRPLQMQSSDSWIPAVVTGFDAPGMWVALQSGQRFFVTNTRKIRPKTIPSPP